VKADYRRQMTTINAPFGQIPLSLFQDEKPTAIPDKAYVILFFADSLTSRTEVGSIYFVMPSNEEGHILATCEIEAAAAYVQPATETNTTTNDNIDLPSPTGGSRTWTSSSTAGTSPGLGTTSSATARRRRAGREPIVGRITARNIRRASRESFDPLRRGSSIEASSGSVAAYR